MMKITKDEVIYVARLAKLEINDDDIDKFVGQIGQILEYVNTLEQVDTDNIALTSHATFSTNAFREDIVQRSLEMETALSNAPMQEDGCFVVPKVIA
jgi:aspartyl-tRNA(Asn)/glutamyl-tRNA(Gln) amidotransferase subunit C